MYAVAILFVALTILAVIPVAYAGFLRLGACRGRPEGSRLQDLAAATGACDSRRQPEVPAERHRRAYMRLGRIVLQKVDAATEFPVSRRSNSAAAGHLATNGSYYLMTPRRAGATRHVPHQDGLADVPLRFRDRHGGTYALTCRLYVN